jgi:hypothetical protein
VLSNEKTWSIIVIIAIVVFSTTTYFALTPMLSRDSTMEQTKNGLDTFVKKFDAFKDEIKYGSPKQNQDT